MITLEASSAQSPEQEVIFDLVNDIFLELPEEDFLALIELENAAFPDLVEIDPDMMVALCRIRSDDCKLHNMLCKTTSYIASYLGVQQKCFFRPMLLPSIENNLTSHDSSKAF